MTESELNLLQQSHFFEHLSPDELKALQKITHIKHYKDDNIIFYKGDAPKHLYILLEGVIQIYKHDKKAREVIMLTESGVASFAELATFEQIPFPANCKSVTDVTIALIDYDQLREKFLSSPTISLAIIKSLSTRVRSLSSLIDRELIFSAEQKVAEFLTHHQEDTNTMKHHQIATELNIAPETLSRVLAKFFKEDILSSRQPIVIKDFELLNEKFDS